MNFFKEKMQIQENVFLREQQEFCLFQNVPLPSMPLEKSDDFPEEAQAVAKVMGSWANDLMVRKAFVYI